MLTAHRRRVGLDYDGAVVVGRCEAVDVYSSFRGHHERDRSAPRTDDSRARPLHRVSTPRRAPATLAIRRDPT